MATEGLDSLPVVDLATHRITGTIMLQDLLRGRSRAVLRENERLRLFSRSSSNSLASTVLVTTVRMGTSVTAASPGSAARE